MIDALRQFLVVAELGSVTAAARRVHLSQPALSAALQRLEAELGAPLLVRTRRGVEPTAAGQVLVAHARTVLAAMDDARRAVAEVSGLRAGEVRVGAGATLCTYVLPRYLAAFREAHPGIRLRLREGTTASLQSDLEDGAIDLALLAGESDEALGGEFWCDDEVILVRGPKSREEAFVTFPSGASTRSLLDRYFPEAEVVMELSSIAAVKGNARAGVGRALVSRFAVVHDLAQGRLVRVRDPRTPLRRVFTLAHRGLERLSPAAAALRGALLADPPRLPRSAAARGGG